MCSLFVYPTLCRVLNMCHCTLKSLPPHPLSLSFHTSQHDRNAGSSTPAAHLTTATTATSSSATTTSVPAVSVEGADDGQSSSSDAQQRLTTFSKTRVFSRPGTRHHLYFQLIHRLDNEATVRIGSDRIGSHDERAKAEGSTSSSFPNSILFIHFNSSPSLTHTHTRTHTHTHHALRRCSRPSWPMYRKRLRIMHP